VTNINLLPAEYKEKEKFKLSRVLIILFIILLAFATAYLYYYLELQIDFKEQQLKTMKSELAAIEKVIKEVKDLEKDKKLIEDRITVIQGLIDNQSRLSRILGEFSASILDEVWVDNLTLSARILGEFSASILDEVWVDNLTLSANQTFNFTANTYNNYLVAKYMVTLKNDPTFDNIELSYVRKNKIREEDRDVDIVNFKLSGIFIPKRLESNKPDQ